VENRIMSREFDEPGAIHARLDALEVRNRELDARCLALARRGRRAVGLAVAVLAGAALWSGSPQARAQFGVTLAQLNARLQAVEAKTAPVVVDATTYSIVGRNVFIQDGSGRTDGATGLGNLTVGYNAMRGNGRDRRTGTHNLIVGDENNYTSYGGAVLGQTNESGNTYASVVGGRDNSATGSHAVVSGGGSNRATNQYASVSGGLQNRAPGVGATVTGGYANEAGGFFAAVSGGIENIADGGMGVVTGGNDNAASGFGAVVSGGDGKTAAIDFGWVGGHLSSP
jgi:hypothetical protein